jgi:hypothetical protein
MTDQPNDPIDPAEPRLARRIQAFSEQAVVPVDAALVARTAVRARRQGFAATGRLGWILAAGLLGIVAVGAAVAGGGARGLFAPVATPTSMGTTPTQEPTPAVLACTPNDVDAVITAWEGAAGSRIATVELHNTAGFTCTMWKVSQPRLVDASGGDLIVGATGSGREVIEIGARDVLRTLVEASNYCGPAPEAPVTVLFRQENGIARDSGIYVATALTPNDLSGIPPCNGPNQPGSIQMQPWTR